MTPIRDCELEIRYTGMLHARMTDGARCVCYRDGDDADFPEEIRAANFARLRDCWNALRGIPTEDLTGLWNHIENCAIAGRHASDGISQKSAAAVLRLCELRKAAR